MEYEDQEVDDLSMYLPEDNSLSQSVLEHSIELDGSLEKISEEPDLEDAYLLESAYDSQNAGGNGQGEGEGDGVHTAGDSHGAGSDGPRPQAHEEGD